MLRGIATYMRRHHLALLALFVALGGTSVAASNALLPRNSVGTAQVINGSLQKVDLSKKAAKALRGNKGAKGPAGQRGPTGLQGIQGPDGPFPGTLPSGKTLRGTYSLTGIATAGAQAVRDGFSYIFTLASNPTQHYISFATLAPPECPGTAVNPQALAGHLCVFETYRANAGTPTVNDQITGIDGSNKQGFYLVLTSTAAGEYRAQGTWAVTSP